MIFGAINEVCNHSFVGRLIGSNSVVIDLGCNNGEFAHTMIRRYQCRVVSAEPVKELYDKIERNPLLELLPVAVGGENRWVEMHVFSGRCASVLRATDDMERSVSQPVEMITLKELLSRAKVHKIDLMKVDIEGAEVDLFNKCSDEELGNITQITVEFHDFMYPEHGREVAKICDRMRRIGFWVMPFSLDHTNILFLNRKAQVSPTEVMSWKYIVKYGKGVKRRLQRTLKIAK
jgi:FkbM family methyltransferase